MAHNLIGFVFCAAVFLAIRESLEAGKSGVPIARVDKWYLRTGLALACGGMVFGTLIGVHPETASRAVGLCLALILTTWVVVRRRLRRHP